MVDATVRLFEEKRGERAQICSLQSSENVSKSRKPIDFCVLSIGFDSFQFSLLSFLFFSRERFHFLFHFLFWIWRRRKEREREKASDYGDDNEIAALERKGGWAEKARSEVSTLLSNSSYFV